VRADLLKLGVAGADNLGMVCRKLRASVALASSRVLWVGGLEIARSFLSLADAWIVVYLTKAPFG
jgi:hypothetical protein